jgi:site-specific recombinase XerD
VALRSFFRFLFHCGETDRDFSACVPTVRKWSQATLPACLCPEEVEQALGVPDRSVAQGRRDYAILLLLARLGLRAGEIVALELGDIHWRAAEITIHGKGKQVNSLPLLADVGQAIADYLRAGRGTSASRQVFLRTHAPRVALTDPGAIGHIVRRVLAQAGIHRRSRGAAHLFRHSLASQMIQHGATLNDISEVLRHQSLNTTEIYAKVDLPSLREVARPWPGKGGGR